MKIDWRIEASDIDAVRRVVKKQQDRNFVKLRLSWNVDGPVRDITEPWFLLVKLQDRLRALLESPLLVIGETGSTAARLANVAVSRAR